LELAGNQNWDEKREVGQDRIGRQVVSGIGAHVPAGSFSGSLARAHEGTGHRGTDPDPKLSSSHIFDAGAGDVTRERAKRVRTNKNPRLELSGR
jgi:hypothetical protein